MTIEDKCMEVRGIKIDPDRIENLKLVRVIRDRLERNSFLFRYGDHTDGSRRGYGDYADHREYSDHTDHRDNHRDYTTGREHSDVSTSGNHWDSYGSHDHTDKGYSEHR